MASGKNLSSRWNPAQWMLFSWTLLLVGGYALFALVALAHWLEVVTGVAFLLPTVIGGAVLGGLLLVQFGAVTCGFYGIALRRSFSDRVFWLWLWGGTLIVMSGGILLWGVLSRNGVIGWVLVFAWLLPVASGAACRLRSCWAAGLAALLESVGVYLSMVLLGNFLFSFEFQRFDGSMYDLDFWWRGASCAADLFASLKVSGSGWSVVFVVAVLTLAGAYLLRAKFFADLAQVPFRRVWSRGTGVAWALFAVLWLTGNGVAGYAGSYVAGRIAAMENAGILLSVPAMETLFKQGTPPSAAFWQQVQIHQDHLLEQMEPDYKVQKSISGSPIEWALSHLNTYSTIRAELAPALAVWRSSWGTEQIPPYPKEFEPGCLWLAELPNLSMSRHAMMLNMLELEYCLRNADPVGARIAYREIDRLSAALENDLFVVGQLVRFFIEKYQITAWSHLLESGLFPIDELDGYARQFAEREARLPDILTRTMQVERGFGTDTLEGLFRKRSYDGGEIDKVLWRPRMLPVELFRYMVPWFWLDLRSDELRTVNALKDDSAELAELSSSCVVADGLFGAAEMMQRVRDRVFPTQAARYRIARMLLAAERYRIEHGAYPTQPEFIEVDPLSGAPLQYQVTPNGIRIWSVGHNRVDDHGAKDDLVYTLTPGSGY